MAEDEKPDTGQTSPSISNQRGDALFALERYSEAVEQYESHLKANPSDQGTWKKLGIAQFNDGQFAKVITSLTSSNYEEDAESWKLLARAETSIGNNDRALRNYQRSVDLKPDDADTWSRFGELQAQTGDPVSAVESFRRAQQLGDQPQVLKLLGMAAAQIPDHSAVVESLSEWLKLESSDGEAHKVLGNSQAALGQHELALEAYRQAASTGLEDGDLFYLAGVSEIANGDTTAALAHLNVAVELDPVHAAALQLLATTQTKLDQHEEALETLDRLQALPETPEAPESESAEAPAIEAVQKTQQAPVRLEPEPDLDEDPSSVTDAKDEEEEPALKGGPTPPPEPPPEPEPTALDVQARATSDRPTRTDTLGLKPLVDGLDALLNSEDTTLPLAIAITAPWGAGKSSVMLQLKDRLSEQGNGAASGYRRRWQTVWLEAWKYEKGERLWAALARAIYEQPYQTDAKRRGSFVREVAWRRLGGRSFVAQLAWRLALTIASFASFFFLGWLVGGPNDGVAAGLAASLFAVAGQGAEAWKSGSFSFLRSLDVQGSRPNYEDQLGFTSAADRDIGQLIAALTRSPDDAIAIFVDDLDRCSSQHVVEVIEAINQIFHASSASSDEERQCVFIMGMDREIVANSIEVAYSKTIESLKADRNPLADEYGYRFLAKIVQMSVAVPEPHQTAIEGLLTLITGSSPPRVR